MIDAVAIARLKEKPLYGFNRKTCFDGTCKKDCDNCENVSDDIKEHRRLNDLVLISMQDVFDVITMTVREFYQSEESFEMTDILRFGIELHKNFDSIMLEEFEEN